MAFLNDFKIMLSMHVVNDKKLKGLYRCTTVKCNNDVKCNTNVNCNNCSTYYVIIIGMFCNNFYQRKM